MNMGNLWQFFGLPDPDASVAPRTQEASAQQATPSLTNEPELTPELVVEDVVESEPQPLEAHVWNGPVTPDGEPFHDLFNHGTRHRIRASRALRYVKPDEKHRIHTRGYCATCSARRYCHCRSAHIGPHGIPPTSM